MIHGYIATLLHCWIAKKKKGQFNNLTMKQFNPSIKFRVNNFSLQRGFTLIELLVVTSLVALIGLMITEIFVLGIRSQSKSEVVKEVKQNGDYALSVIESMVKNAVDIQCSSGTSSLMITNQDQFTTTFVCDDSSQLASISGGFPEPTPSVSQPLTNNRVAATNCTFKVVCPTLPFYPKYVYVNYTVGQAVPTGQPTPLPESRSSLEYQTTVSLRTYQ